MGVGLSSLVVSYSLASFPGLRVFVVCSTKFAQKIASWDSARISYCKRQTRKAWEWGYTQPSHKERVWWVFSSAWNYNLICVEKWISQHRFGTIKVLILTSAMNATLWIYCGCSKFWSKSKDLDTCVSRLFSSHEGVGSWHETNKW